MARSAIQAVRRVRCQVVCNLEYGPSIRVIQINGQKTEEELRDIIKEFLISNKSLLQQRFKYMGFETEEIDMQEDKNLKEGHIYLEIESAQVKGDRLMDYGTSKD